MNNPPLNGRVFCLVTCLEINLFESCTLNFSTIRTAFPTCEITIHVNGNSLWKDRIVKKALDHGLDCIVLDKTFFHADYLHEIVTTNANPLLYSPKPTIIVDADIIFWENCEFEVAEPWSGMWIPVYQNEWAGLPSVERIHPSFLIIPDCALLLNLIKSAYPMHGAKFGDYCGFRPFHPVTTFFEGSGLFYDTCANLHHLIPGLPFTDSQLNAYSHLNSASFYSTVLERFSDPTVKENFRNAHEYANSFQWEKLRGLNKLIMNYYLSRRR